MLPRFAPSPPPQHALPPGHFLALPPTFPERDAALPSESPLTSSHASSGLAPNVASLASADFEVDVRTGFLPATRNIDRLSGVYEVWEEALDAARGNAPGEGLRLGGTRDRELMWRAGIEQMTLLDTAALRVSLLLLRRAHLVLAFLTHFYVHTSPSGSTSRSTPLPIPASISVPFLTVSPLVGLPPVLTYADTVLYNFHAHDPVAELSLTNPPHTALATFTNTKSEEQFYIISALCEIAGAEALRLMRQSLDELFLADEVALRRLVVYLRKLAQQIDRIGDITLSMMQGVDPEEFYHLIRPWFRGGDSEGPGSLGWAFLGLDGSDQVEWAAENRSGFSTDPNLNVRGRLFSGPSAGQSSLIHAIDIFLTVDHVEEDQPDLPAPDAQSMPSVTQINLESTPVTITAADPKPVFKPSEATFLQRMLEYMPLQHRTFLLHLSTHPTLLRPLVVKHAKTHPRLAEAYDGALEALKRFREKHMRIASMYVVQQARRQPSERIRQMLGSEHSGVGAAMQPEGEMRGTGGTPLFTFLKRCRDNTTRAMIGKSAGPSFELK